MTVLPTEKFETNHSPTWCPGCGDFALWTAVKNAFVTLGYQPHEVAVVFDIGCHGNGANTLKAYTFHGLHGRALPIAFGVAMANHNLKVLVISGDGGGYGEGAGHFLHTIRANPNITYVVHNNSVYGLTKGQASPTTPEGMKTDSTPTGAIDEPLNPVAVALAADCSMVSRGFAGDVPHLTDLLVQSLRHRGFSLLDVLQPCVTFNHMNTYAWWYKHIEKISEPHVTSDKMAAWALATNTPKVPIGVFYQADRPVYQDRVPALKHGPLVHQDHAARDLTTVLKAYR